MVAAALAAIEEIFTPPFRTIFWKTIGLTLLLLGALWAIVEKLIVAYVHVPWGWLQTTIHVLTGVGLFVGVVFLVTPVAFVVAGLFFDELADHVETDIAGPAGRGRAMALAPALWIGVKFGIVALIVNIAALGMVLFLPGINVAAAFAANAYLLGRGFFELAALRYRPLEDVREMRRVHAARIFLAGCLPAALALVPILNLLTPLFATALMVRITQPIVARHRLPRQAQPNALRGS